MAVKQNAPVQGRVSKIYDHLYANAPVKTPSAIAYEFGKIAHTCLFLERENGGRPPFSDLATQQKQMGGDGSSRIAGRVRADFLRMAAAWQLYGDDLSIVISDFDIAYTVSLIGDLSFSDPRSDLLGDIFEIIRSQFAKERGGQFFTDPQVTHLAMRLLRFDPVAGDDLVDICAGTGGFLLAGMAHLEERFEGRESASLTALVRRAFHGIEIDPEAADTANGTIMARFGREAGSIVRVRDALKLNGGASGDTAIRFGSHRCVATNPPFGTKITVKDPAVLAPFQLARHSPRDGKPSDKLSPQPPDVLFLEQNLRLLVPEQGRLAIVLPYQMLSGPAAVGIRDWLIRHARVLAVVDLPADTFQPHTGTKGALVVLSSRSRPLAKVEDASGERIFMAVPRHVGHDRRGNAVYRKDDAGRVTTEIHTDMPDVGVAFERFVRGDDPETGHAYSFALDVADVVASPLRNLNASFYLGGSGPIPARHRDMTFVPLGDLVDRVFFPGRFKRQYVAPGHPGAVPFLGGAGITEFISTGRKWISPEDPTLARLRVRAGWILITRSGSTGIVSTVPEVWDGHAISEHVIRVVPDPAKMLPGYLFAVLSSEYGQAYLRRGVFGSVIDEITPDYVSALPVPLPDGAGTLDEVAALMRAAEDERASAMSAFVEAVAKVDRMMG